MIFSAPIIVVSVKRECPPGYYGPPGYYYGPPARPAVGN
jgi:hypothetical protein